MARQIRIETMADCKRNGGGNDHHADWQGLWTMDGRVAEWRDAVHVAGWAGDRMKRRRRRRRRGQNGLWMATTKTTLAARCWNPLPVADLGTWVGQRAEEQPRAVDRRWSLEATPAECKLVRQPLGRA